jgi:DNA-nicking Smr family endonuclease
VALYYAQRAREVTEKAREDALNEARELVEAKRYASDDKRSIDLHGTCVQEAIVITSEILEREGCSPASPLRLITGRGTHSVGGVGVLKPAVHRALVNKGWDVRMWDGGLVVQGRARERWHVP